MPGTRTRTRTKVGKTRRQAERSKGLKHIKKSIKHLHKQLGGLGTKKYLMIKQRANECYVDTLIIALLHYKNPEIIADFVEGAGPLKTYMEGFLKSLSVPAKELAARQEVDCVLVESFRKKVAELQLHNKELQPVYPPRAKLPRYHFSQPITLLNALYEIIGITPTVQGERTDINLVRYFLEKAKEEESEEEAESNSPQVFTELADNYAMAINIDDYVALDTITGQVMPFVQLEISNLQEDPDQERLITVADLDEISDILTVPYGRKYPYEEQVIATPNIYEECVSDALQMLKGDGISATIVKGGKAFDSLDESRSRAMLVHKHISHLKSYVFVSVDRQPGVEEHFQHVEIPIMFTSEIEGGDGVRIFFLVSMICYTQNHFVCFVKADGGEDNWYLFDDMASPTKRYTEIGPASDMFLHLLNVGGEEVVPTERAVFLVYSEAVSDEGGETNLEGTSESESEPALAPIELAKTSRTLRAAVAAAVAKPKPKPKVDDFDTAAAIEASLMEAPPSEDIENALAIGQEEEDFAAALKASLAGH